MRLRYYEQEELAYPRHAATRLKTWAAVALAQDLLERLGEPPAAFHIGRKPRNWDMCDQAKRLITFNPPEVSVLAVIHEVAHLWALDHDTQHATTICLFVEVLRSVTK
jgi:predicted metal-dependent hydrolase